MQDAQHKAFISYSHRNDKCAPWLHRQLEADRSPEQLIGTETEQREIERLDTRVALADWRHFS